MVIADHIMRAFGMKWFYTDYGVYPTSAVRHMVYSLRKPSVHALSGEIEPQIALFILAGLASVALILGWRTRMASVLCWFLTISVQHRFVQINSGADVLLSGLLFWSMFLPLGARFSLDARRRPDNSPHDNEAYSGATFALIGQIVLLYMFNVLSKYGSAWYDGSAVLRALHIDQYATPLGAWVRDVIPWATYPMARITVVVEASVFLMFVPWGRKWIRLYLVAAFWAMHIGFNAFLYLALFSPVSMVAWLAIIPTEAWEMKGFKRLGARMRRGLGPRHRLPKLVSVGLIAALFVFPGWSNAEKLWGWKRPYRVSRYARWIRLNQIWKMFAPAPLRTDFWWVVETRTKGGKRIDLMRDGDKLTWDKPEYTSHMYITGKHRRLWMSLKCDKRPLSCKRILDRMCLDHNEGLAADDPNRAVRITLWKMKERTPKNLKMKPKVKKKREFRRRCPSSRKEREAKADAKN
jgi:hypothetical protein